MCDVVSKQIREYFPEDDFQSDGKLHIECYVVKMLETETGKNKNVEKSISIRYGFLKTETTQLSNT